MLANRFLRGSIAVIAVASLLALVNIYKGDRYTAANGSVNNRNSGGTAAPPVPTAVAGTSESDDSRPHGPDQSSPRAATIDDVQSRLLSFGTSHSTTEFTDDSIYPNHRNYAESDSPLSSSPEAQDEVDHVPRFWSLANAGGVVRIASDFRRVWHGSASVLLQAEQPIHPTTQAGVIQVSSATPFRDKRIRYSGSLRLEMKDMREPASAMIWIRVDDASGRVVAFQNTLGQLRFHNSAWQQAVVIIDIPPEAFSLHYGASLFGNGALWVDGLLFEEVDEATPATAAPMTRLVFNRVPSPKEILRMPVNLDFEETRSTSEPQ